MFVVVVGVVVAGVAKEPPIILLIYNIVHWRKLSYFLDLGIYFSKLLETNKLEREFPVGIKLINFYFP